MGQSHRWEFRRRDSHFDPSGSSDELESSSGSELDIKKHKAISSFIPCKTDEARDVSGFQWKSRYAPLPKEQLQAEKSNKVKIGTNEKEDDPVYGGGNGIGKICAPATLGDTRVLMETILEELKVAREKMLIWMREEMHKMMDEDSGPESTMGNNNYKDEMITEQHPNSFNSESNVQNCNAETSVGSVKRKRTISSHTSNDILGDQAEYCLPAPSLVEPEGPILTSSIKGPSYSISPSDQVGSSMYLTLPTVLPKAHVTSLRFSSPSCNYVPTNRMTPNIKSDPTTNSSKRVVSSPRGQNEEKLKNVPPICSQNLDYFGQSKFDPTSSFSGFPVPFRHGYKIQAQVGMQNLSQIQDNTSSVAMSRGMSVVREDHISEHYVGNNLGNHVNYGGNADGWTHGNLIPGSQRGLVMQELLYQE